jgi:hypothetical protein
LSSASEWRRQEGNVEGVVIEKPGVGEFVNADEIARGLSPDNIEHAAMSAGRAMLERMNGQRTRQCLRVQDDLPRTR